MNHAVEKKKKRKKKKGEKKKKKMADGLELMMNRGRGGWISQRIEETRQNTQTGIC